MKIIFLDIDGVLNSSKFMLEIKGKGLEFNDNIDPESVRLLNEIIARTNAKVVISSTLRHGYLVKELYNILKKEGFNGHIIGFTPSDPKYRIRGEEIQAWLDQNKGVESFVILDDDSDMGDLTYRLVKTNMVLGLQEKHVKKATMILNEWLF